MKTNKLVSLTEKHTGGLNSGIKYYADSKEISWEKFQEIKNGAVSLECLSNANKNGVWVFYTTAVMN